MKKANTGETPGFDVSKDPKYTIGFRGWFLIGDGYLASKTIKRKDLKKMRYVREVNAADIKPIIKMAFEDSKEFFDDAVFSLVPSILVQDHKTNEYLLIPKSCYWW